MMANAGAWCMFLLNITHILFGLIKFKGQVADAISAGFIGNFAMAAVDY